MIVSSVISRPVQVSVLSNTYAVNMAALKAIDISEMAGNTQISVAGYYTPGDGGGGTFYYDSGSSSTDDGGTVIAPDVGGGRWKRVYYGEVDARAFGLVGDGSDETAVLQKAIDALAPVGVLLNINSGTYRCKNVLIRNGSSIRGAGPSTVLKLLDGSVVGDHILRGENTTSGVDNVYIGHIKIDGNGATIGLSDVSMHGIYLVGGHNNWTIENVTAQNTCGDGITVSTPDGGVVPKNIRIINVSVSNSGRQDISVVRASGVTIDGCSGDGRLDLEANTGDGASLYGVVVTNARFDEIHVAPRGAESGGFLSNNITVSGAVAITRFHLWQVANGSFSGIVCGSLTVSECDTVYVSNVVTASAQVYAPNNTTIRNCRFSNMEINCSTDNAAALAVSQAINCEFDNITIRSSGANGDGIKITNATTQSSGTLTFRDIDIITHVRYGIYCVPTLFSGLTIRVLNSTIRSAGTRAIYSTSGSSLTYGTYLICGCYVYGGITLQDFLRVDIDKTKIIGDNTLLVKDSRDASIYLDDIEFIRSTSGTSSIDLQSNTTLTSMVIGTVRQRSGGITATLTSSTFASGVKAWINGPVVEATTWASTLADADIKEGSMYRLRGNTTNYAYTHNGTSWVAKAH